MKQKRKDQDIYSKHPEIAWIIIGATALISVSINLFFIIYAYIT